MLRAQLKGLAELIAIRAGGRVVGSLLQRGRVLILAYHNVVPRGEKPCGDRSLHLPQETFSHQLDELQERYDIVPLIALWDGPVQTPRPRAALTFDDGYVGTLTAGIEELRRRGLPATVFVPPAFVGGRTFWWDELAEGFAGAIPAELRNRLLAELSGDHDAIRNYAITHGLALAPSLPAWACAATEAQLHAAAAYQGLTFGSHTWSHLNLATVDLARRQVELSRSKDWLESRLAGSTIPWLSYPYGLDSPEARAAARAAGYTAALRGNGGHFSPRVAPVYGVPRLNVPAGLSAAGFGLRAAGLFER